MRIPLRLFLLLTVLTTAFGSGCNSGSEPGGSAAVNKSNLAKIQPGMTVSEVQVIMGAGDTIVNGSARVNKQRVPDEEHTWRNGEKMIVVTFVEGKVVYTTSANL